MILGDDIHLSNQEAKFRVEEGDSRVSYIGLVRNSLKESFSLSVESRGGSRSPGEEQQGACLWKKANEGAKEL